MPLVASSPARRADGGTKVDAECTYVLSGFGRIWIAIRGRLKAACSGGFGDDCSRIEFRVSLAFPSLHIVVVALACGGGV